MINLPLAKRPWLQSALAFLLLWPLGLGAAHSASELRWATAWGAAPDSTGPSLSSKTVRQIARLGIGGSHVRLRLSNLFGAGPLSIGSVRLAIHAGGSAIQRDTERAVTFTANPGVTIPKGGDALSDPLNAGISGNWIRTSGAFDSVIDFERVMTDPARPGHLRPAFDSGDHLALVTQLFLHPNDAGYTAMASAIDLRLFTEDK